MVPADGQGSKPGNTWHGRCSRKWVALRCRHTPSVSRHLPHPPFEPCLRQDNLGKEEETQGFLSETFRRNPVGNQSHPVEPGRQPEASLVSVQVTARAKRRQPVLRPCY